LSLSTAVEHSTRRSASSFQPDSDECNLVHSASSICGCPIPEGACYLWGEGTAVQKPDLQVPYLLDIDGLTPTCEFIEAYLHSLSETESTGGVAQAFTASYCDCTESPPQDAGGVYPFMIVNFTLSPLQDFLNFLVYARPRIQNLLKERRKKRRIVQQASKGATSEGIPATSEATPATSENASSGAPFDTGRANNAIPEEEAENRDEENLSETEGNTNHDAKHSS
jgi:hypothetical protein